MGLAVVVTVFLSAVIPSPPPLHPLQARAPQNARINGTLRLPPGETKPPNIVQITLTTMYGAFVESKTLSSETSFVFERIDYGQYLITVESFGFETTTQILDVETPYRDIMIVVPLGPRIPAKEEEVQTGEGSQTVSVKTLTLPPKALKEFQKGEAEAKKGKPDKAINHFKKVLEISPDYFPALEAMGMEYAALQRWQEAIRSLESALEYQPENPKGRRNLAQLYLSQARFDDAIEQLNAASVTQPNNSKTLRLLGESYLGLKECPTALDYFLAATEINKEDHSHLGIGQCYLQAGKVAEALEEFRGFLAGNPRDPRAESIRQFIARVEKDLASQR